MLSDPRSRALIVPTPLRAILIDIDGVLCIGPAPIPRAGEALARLRRRGVGLRFVTNTTRRTRGDIVAQMRQIGLDVMDDEVITGALAARRLAEQNGWRPHLLVHPGLLPDFEGLEARDPNAVIVGDAGEGFSYAALNEAFIVRASAASCRSSSAILFLI